MWQTPVYDRTAADVAAGAEKCYITAELLNRIEGNTAHMAQLLGVEIDTRTWTSLGLLTRAQMQRILDNLATVRAAYYTLPGTPNIPTAPSTLYSAINDMEQVLWSLHELWQRNSVKPVSYTHLYYSLHNHPSNGILSPEDIQQLIKRPQMQGIGAVGNAGALFTCEKVFGYSQKNAEGWFKTLKKKYPLYKGESGKIEDALAQRIAFAEELRRDGAKYGLVFSR